MMGIGRPAVTTAERGPRRGEAATLRVGPGRRCYCSSRRIHSRVPLMQETRAQSALDDVAARAWQTLLATS
jgi:hypothetical protein